MPGHVLSVVPSDLGSCDSASSFLQSGFWGSFKARFGWNARGFSVDWAEGGRLPLLVIRRRLPFGSSFAYVPWGPELPAGFPASDAERSRALEELARALRPQLPPDTAFIRFDPPWAAEGEASPVVAGGFRRAGADVQPPDTVILDLSSTEEELLSAMKPKWRYNVRLAERRGVKVERRDEAGLDAFYGLYRETARRDRIAIHGLDYYRALFAHAAEYKASGQDLRLYVAAFEEEPIAAIVTLFRGGEAVYLYGASSDAKRSLMPAYALQWRAIRDAKAAGALTYDFFGIPPKEDPSHPMAGLYRFKTGFGGRIVHRPGSWDYAYKGLETAAFRFAEAARKGLRDARKSGRRAAAGE